MSLSWIVEGPEGDCWPGFSVSTVAGLLVGTLYLGRIGCSWNFGGGDIISWVRVPTLAQLRAGVHSSLN